MLFEDIKAGLRVSYSQKITDHDIRRFADLSGDHNPIHLSEEYIATSRFKKRVAHGLLPVSFFSGLFGSQLPGPGCLYVSQSIEFKRPIYIEDTVTATVEVLEVDVISRHVKFKTICEVGGRVVVGGHADIFVPKEVKTKS